MTKPETEQQATMSEKSESGDDSLDISDLTRLETGTAHIARVYDYWLGGYFL